MQPQKVWAVYFSGTGTTEKTVRRIASSLAAAFSAPLAEKPVFFGVQIKVRVLRPSQAERAERLDFIPSCLSIGDADPRTARSIKNRDGFVFRSHPLTRPWAGSLVYFSLALGAADPPLFWKSVPDRRDVEYGRHSPSRQ